MKILVTGCAGFIGSNLCDRLLKAGHSVIGVDNFNNYYDPIIKERNLEDANNNNNFKLYREDILNYEEVFKIFSRESPQVVVHLAARAGVRPSIANPLLYTSVNVAGTVNLLKLSSDFKIQRFIFGSSSSVYGNSRHLPFSEDDPCDSIVSPYGSSKRAAEFFVESFWKTYGLKSTILRFFTVYGPRGRPDMAPALFTKNIFEGKRVNLFGDGKTYRDYTYIDDIIAGIENALVKELEFEIINLGNNNPILLKSFVEVIEGIVGKKVKLNSLPFQNGDVKKTWANNKKSDKLLAWRPKIKVQEGLKNYIEWLRKGH